MAQIIYVPALGHHPRHGPVLEHNRLLAPICGNGQFLLSAFLTFYIGSPDPCARSGPRSPSV